jgi:hypothetical protein
MVKAKTKILDLFWAFVEFRRAMAGRLFNPYRPELHYMRGPGPRWREKQNVPPI